MKHVDDSEFFDLVKKSRNLTDLLSKSLEVHPHVWHNDKKIVLDRIRRLNCSTLHWTNASKKYVAPQDWTVDPLDPSVACLHWTNKKQETKLVLVDVHYLDLVVHQRWSVGAHVYRYNPEVGKPDEPLATFLMKNDGYDMTGRRAHFLNGNPLDNRRCNLKITGGAPADGHKVCSRCLERKPLDEFAFKNTDQASWHAQCKACRKYTSSQLSALYVQKRGSAKSRGIEFNLSFEKFCSLKSQTKCACCGASFEASSLRLEIDRRDNQLGYEDDNCFALCRICNNLKRDASIAQIEALLTYMKE